MKICILLVIATTWLTADGRNPSPRLRVSTTTTEETDAVNTAADVTAEFPNLADQEKLREAIIVNENTAKTALLKMAAQLRIRIPHHNTSRLALPISPNGPNKKAMLLNNRFPVKSKMTPTTDLTSPTDTEKSASSLTAGTSTGHRIVRRSVPWASLEDFTFDMEDDRF
jgi:hypothetical protein